MAPPPAPGRVGTMEVGTHRAAAGWGGRSETLRAPVPAGPGQPWRGEVLARAAAAADAMLGSVGNGALGRLPSGQALGLEPPRPSAGRRPEGRDRERRLGTWTSRRPSKLWDARTRVPRSCGLKTWQGLGVRGTLCPSSVFYTTLYENGTTQIGSDREQWLTRYLEFFFFLKFYDLLPSFFFFNVIKGRELVPQVTGVALYTPRILKQQVV